MLRKAIFFVVLLAAGYSVLRADDLKVTLINAGVGESILIQTPGGKNVLLDGGYTGPGNSVVIPYLISRGVTRLHYMIVSSSDSDHSGGLNAILGDNDFTVEQVLYKGANVKARLTNLGSVPAVELPTVINTAPQTISIESGLTVKLLSSRNTESSVNNNSLVIKLVYKNISFLFTGDIETPVVDQIVDNYPTEFPITFLKVPHHGSNSSYSAKFPARIEPQMALISCAKDINNNPDDDTLLVYEVLGIPVMRTDQSGHITIVSNGTTYSVATSLTSTDVTTVSAKPTVHVYPNPAPGTNNPAKATIVYELNGFTDDVRVAVYTVAGELVRSWSGAPKNIGTNYLEWDLKNGSAEDVVNGLYWVQVEARALSGVQVGKSKMAVLKK